MVQRAEQLCTPRATAKLAIEKSRPEECVVAKGDTFEPTTWHLLRIMRVVYLGAFLAALD